MPDKPFHFLRYRPAAIVTAILLTQSALFYAYPTAEFIPDVPPLGSFETQSGAWKMQSEIALDAETQDFLKADDTLNRVYAGPAGSANLFVAFFKSQRAGVTPHSPKVCLPGAGWVSEASAVLSVQIPGDAKPIPVNRYVVRHGEDRRLVLYWYATAHHTMADEYVSKLYLMHEGLRYRRSDEAIYRVITPILGDGEAGAQSRAVDFIHAFYPPLRHRMWPAETR
jgi:EpsI family protein